MTGDEDRPRSGAGRAADVAGAETATDSACQLAVASGLAVRDLGDALPDLPRLVAAAGGERQGEISARGGEVLDQLGNGLIEAVIVARVDMRPERIPVRTGPVAGVVQAGRGGGGAHT